MAASQTQTYTTTAQSYILSAPAPGSPYIGDYNTSEPTVWADPASPYMSDSVKDPSDQHQQAALDLSLSKLTHDIKDRVDSFRVPAAALAITTRTFASSSSSSLALYDKMRETICSTASSVTPQNGDAAVSSSLTIVTTNNNDNNSSSSSSSSNSSLLGGSAIATQVIQAYSSFDRRLVSLKESHAALVDVVAQHYMEHKRDAARQDDRMTQMEIRMAELADRMAIQEGIALLPPDHQQQLRLEAGPPASSRGARRLPAASTSRRGRRPLALTYGEHNSVGRGGGAITSAIQRPERAPYGSGHGTPHRAPHGVGLYSAGAVFHRESLYSASGPRVLNAHGDATGFMSFEPESGADTTPTNSSTSGTIISGPDSAEDPVGADDPSAPVGDRLVTDLLIHSLKSTRLCTPPDPDSEMVALCARYMLLMIFSGAACIYTQTPHNNRGHRVMVAMPDGAGAAGAAASDSQFHIVEHSLDSDMFLPQEAMDELEKRQQALHATMTARRAPSTLFVPPSFNDVMEYCRERGSIPIVVFRYDFMSDLADRLGCMCNNGDMAAPQLSLVQPADPLATSYPDCTTEDLLWALDRMGVMIYHQEQPNAVNKTKSPYHFFCKASKSLKRYYFGSGTVPERAKYVKCDLVSLVRAVFRQALDTGDFCNIVPRCFGMGRICSMLGLYKQGCLTGRPEPLIGSNLHWLYANENSPAGELDTVVARVDGSAELDRHIAKCTIVPSSSSSALALTQQTSLQDGAYGSSSSDRGLLLEGEKEASDWLCE